jgi:hypothetical protein
MMILRPVEAGNYLIREDEKTRKLRLMEDCWFSVPWPESNELKL